jgi:hypothetical protein
VGDFYGFLGHDGEIFDYQSFMSSQPQTGATIIVLVNLYQGPGDSIPADGLAELIQQELFA